MIDRPDKFEGEPEFVEYFWKRAQNGEAEKVDKTVFKFTIDEKDTKKFPTLKVGQRILVAESPDGFVFYKLLPKLVEN